MLDVDGIEIYNISTGKTVGELENLSKEQLKELLEGKENGKYIASSKDSNYWF